MLSEAIWPEGIRPKLVAFDLDGTLLRSDRTLSPRNKAAIAGLVARGVRVLICTGRPPRTAKAIAEELALVDLGVVYNGAAVYNFATDTALTRFDYPGEVAHRVLERMRRDYPGVTCGLEASYGWFVDRARYDLLRRGPYPYETEPDGVGDVADFIREDVTKLLFWHADAAVETMHRSLDSLPVHGTWSMPGLLEVVGQGVNKCRALEWVASDLGLKAEEVAAFGDEDNDKEMLAWAGLGVAMANATANVKAHADWVTTSCDEDGVAEVVERWL